ncbi:hypothetical protein RchiOBHm_Chr7g0238551 [Rosa chinensis]|uniref:Uncharacterized protein n=1 Tax=Rosa chinensis TaxID=74649 RepID=A0A2P6PHG4_ROSCH|nr:hypothetical protein RchiOBHm_Chr7g0238551 [Rosa chinensis]
MVHVCLASDVSVAFLSPPCAKPHPFTVSDHVLLTLAHLTHTSLTRARPPYPFSPLSSLTRNLPYIKGYFSFPQGEQRRTD